MIKILIVDDDIQKLNNVTRVIEENCDKEKFEIKHASFANDVYNILNKENIDIMILDICFPDRLGADADRKAGTNLLKRLKGSNRFVYPRFVVALSQYEDLVQSFSEDMGLIHSSISYDTSTNEWKIRLIECVNTAIAILSNGVQRRCYDYDIAIICALKEELEIFRQICDPCKQYELEGDDNDYFLGTFEKEGKKVRVVMTCCTQMGMVSAATLATKMIYNFAPKYLVMTGIAAGIRDKANYGDVLAAEYSWDYGAGKEAVTNGKDIHKNTIQQIQIDTDITKMIRNLSNDEEALARIKRGFNGDKPDTELRIHLGHVASGASVVSNSKIVEKVQEQIRDVIGIEMEIYGVYYASRWAVYPKPKFVALKSVCDYADEKKDDMFHKYASYTSAKALEILAKEYFEYE